MHALPVLFERLFGTERHSALRADRLDLVVLDERHAGGGNSRGEKTIPPRATLGPESRDIVDMYHVGMSTLRSPRVPAEPDRGWVWLDPSNPEPVSNQLYRQVVSAILSGEVPVGTVLPSARALAAQLRIHYHTTTKSYGMLRRDGFLRLDHRRRAIAERPAIPAPKAVTDWTERQRDLVGEGLRLGIRPDELIRRFHLLVDRRAASNETTA